jgi:hypothetical protein
MRITSSGNVGIGATSPASQLVVSDAGTDSRILIQHSGTGNTLTDGLLLGAIGSNFYVQGYDAYPLIFGTSGLERMRIDSSGNVLVTSAAGLGYGTGAGGTVTQATSKSTAVTLNKPTGQITMNNAALGAGAVVAFVVNNSLVASTDTVILVPVSSSNYTVICQSLGAGQFTVRVTNVTGGSLSEALQINFAIIKGATA